MEMPKTWTPPDPETFDWWEEACACYDKQLPNPPITEQPQSGYYRAKFGKDGDFVPVIYYYHNGALITQVGTDESQFIRDNGSFPDGKGVRESWPYISKRPVRLKAYDFFKEHGHWPDMSSAVYRGAVDYPPPGLSQFEEIKWQINELIEEANDLIKSGPAKNKEEAERATDLHNRLIAYHKTSKSDLLNQINSDPRITEEMRKHHIEFCAIHDGWRDIYASCEIYKSLKATVIAPYGERIAKEMAQAGQKETPKIRAPSGRAIAPRKITKARIVKYEDACVPFLLNEKVVAVIQSLCDKMAAEGTCPPGCEIYTETQWV